MNNDPADLRARARRRVGAQRETQQTRARLHHPSRGGTRGYPVWFRDLEIQQHAQGLPPIAASPASIYRWMQQLAPYRMMGNKESEMLVGYDQFLLIVYTFAHPDALLEEIAAFIFRQGGGLYTPSQISTRLDELDISRKCASTEAHQAYLPQNVFKAQMFWTQPPPLGVVGIQRRKLVDFDEAAFSLEKINRKKGRASVGIRVRKRGHYTHGQKVVVRIAISPGDPTLPPGTYGSTANPRRWVEISLQASTSATDFANLCTVVMDDIDQHEPGNDDRYFLWDNLQSHLAPIVYQTVHGRQGIRLFHIIP